MCKMIILLFLIPILTYGSSRIDSLRKDLDLVTGLDKINTLHQLAEEYIDSFIDSTILLSNQAVDLSRKIKNKKALYYSLYLLSNAYDIRGNYQKAERLLIDILKNETENEYATDHLPILFELGKNQYLLSKYKSSLKFFMKLEKASSVNNNEGWNAIAQDAIGSIHYAQSNFTKALMYHYKSLTLYRKLKDDESIAGSYYSIGADYNGLSMYDKAIENYLESINLSEILNNEKILAMSIHAMGMTYQELNNYTQSLEYNLKALSIAEKNGDKNLMASILSNIGIVKLSEKNYSLALKYFFEGLAINKKIKSKIGIATSFDNIGFIHYKLNDLEKALYFSKKALSISESIEEKWKNSHILNHLGLYYLDSQDFPKSFSFLNTSLASALEIKSQDLIQNNLSALSDYYAATNDYEKAYDYLMRFSQLRDSIITQSSHNIAEMQMRYEKGKQEKEKQILLDKIHIQGLELERSRLERWLTALSLLLFSLILFWGYSRLQVKKRANILLERRIDQAMKDHEKQQKIIFHQASLSSLGELAAGMAHEINQPLQDLKLCAESIELYMRESGTSDPSVIKSIGEIYLDVDRIEQIVDHARKFSSQQKNHVDKLFTVNSVVDDALSMIGKQCTKHSIALHLDLKKNIGRVKGNPYKLEQVLINILSNAKDAILAKNNKVKGSFDKQIDILTSKDENTTIIEINDNGIGIKPEYKDSIFNSFYTTKKLGEGTGLGLSIAQEIIKEFEGDISINSEYMRGTNVEIRLPQYMRNPNPKRSNQI